MTTCIDFTPSSRVAAWQETRLARSCGAELRFLCPYHLGWADLQGIGETRGSQPGVGRDYERRCAGRIREWLNLSAPELDWIDVVCREVPNWDHRNRLLRALADEDADLLVLPLRRHSLFAGLRDASLIEAVVSVVSGSLLVVRL